MALVRRWGPLLLGGTLVVVVYFVLPVQQESAVHATALRVLATVLGVVAMGALVTRELRRQVQSGYDRRLDGLLLAVIVVVVGFSLIYFLVNRNDPAQVSGLHTRIDALYFTMSTMTTVGYGDVHAEGQAARALVVVQLVFNLVFVTTAAALVSSRIRSAVSGR